MKKVYHLDIGGIDDNGEDVSYLRSVNVLAKSFEAAVVKVTERLEDGEYIESCAPASADIDY